MDPRTTRAFVFTQVDASKGSLTANGKRKDAAGHIGTWDYQASGSSNVDNRLETTSRLGDGGWAETGRSFTTDKSSEQSDRYHEDDDGLGLPRTPERMTASYGNTLDTTSKSSSSLRAAGTPARYTVNSKLDTQSTRRETHRGSYEKPAVDPTGAVTSEVMRGNSSSESYTGRILQDTHDGVVANGEANWSVIDTYAMSRANSKSDATEVTPWRESERHQRGDSTDEMLVKGSSREGDRDRWVKPGSWSWGKTITRSAWGSGITTYGTPGPVSVPKQHLHKSWGRGPVNQRFTVEGMLAQDFVNDPGVQWLYRNGSDVLRIVGGVIDVGVGAATALGTGGLGILPGVGLMAVGIDQIATGVTNISTGAQAPSLFEFGGYSAARGLGAGEDASHVIGALTPAVLSVAFTGVAQAMPSVGRAAPRRGAFAAQADPAAHATDFATRRAETFERLIQQRMRELGVPEHLIGDMPIGGGARSAFHPEAGTGGGVTLGRGINVDSGVLNPNLLGEPAAGGAATVWARARLRHRIEAVIAHEFEECMRGTDVLARQHAPTTVLNISEEARDILRAMAP